MIGYDELIAAAPPRASRRIPYGPHPLQFGELWLPPDAHASPARRTTVVFVHGGCWEAEYGVAHAAYAAAALAAAGYVVWLPEYRRLGDAGGGWPGTFDDVAAAADFVHALAELERAVDPTRVIAAGHSAGGQLALWLASRPRDAAHATVGASERPLRVIGVVALAAISDLAIYGAAPGGCNASVAPLLGGPPSSVAERYRAVDPASRLPIGVPIELVHGDRDPIVPMSMSVAFAAQAEAAGDEVRVTKLTGAGHFDVIAPQTSVWPAVIRAVAGISPPR